jgi:hypothetical protein
VGVGVEVEQVVRVALPTPTSPSGPRKSRMLLWPQSLSDYGAICGFHRAGSRDSAFNYLRDIPLVYRQMSFSGYHNYS